MKAINLSCRLALAAAMCLPGQANLFTGMNETGKLVLSTSVNVLQLAQSAPSSSALATSLASADGLEFQASPRRLQPGAARMVSDGKKYGTSSSQFVISPTFRGATLAATVVRQGYLLVSNNDLLRPSIAMNAQSRGAIVFTLVGPDYLPSAAFVLLDNSSTGSSIQIAASGVLPEDGFSGYPNTGFPEQGPARWGDYSTAVAANDGSIWMATEFISNAPRTQLANWDTMVAQVQQ